MIRVLRRLWESGDSPPWNFSSRQYAVSYCVVEMSGCSFSSSGEPSSEKAEPRARQLADAIETMLAGYSDEEREMAIRILADRIGLRSILGPVAFWAFY